MILRKVLVIENQWKQFCEISDQLAMHFSVLPAREVYIEFIDHVRVYLNNRYTGVKRRQSLAAIGSVIRDNSIELIIIDHILVGVSTAETGIELAEELRKEFKHIPIIFLSRTPSHDLKVKDKYRGIENAVWVEKGYAGMRITDKNYFKAHVLKEVTNRLGKTEYEYYHDILEQLADSKLLTEHYPQLEQIKQGISTTKVFDHKMQDLLKALNKMVFEKPQSVSLANIRKLFDAYGA